MPQNIPFLYGGGLGQNAPTLPGLSLLQPTTAPAPSVHENARSGTEVLPEQQSFMAQHSSLLNALQALSPEQLRSLEGMLPSLQATEQSIPAAVARSSNTVQRTPRTGSAVVVGSSGSSDVEKEDGEVDEADDAYEGESADLKSVMLRPTVIPTAPRSMQPSMNKKQKLEHQGGRNPSSPILMNGHNTHAVQKSVTGHSKRKATAQKKSQAHAFLKETAQAGYSYQDLIALGVDGKFLKPVYNSLQLPVHSKSATTLNEVPEYQIKTASQSQPAYPTVHARSSDPPKAPAPKLNAPVPSRAEYLARLQAAKSKKSASSSRQAPQPQNESAKTTAELHSTAVTPAIEPTPSKLGATNTKASSVKGKTVDREALNAKLRERLEKMRNAQAAKQSTPSNVEVMGTNHHADSLATQGASTSADKALHRTISAQSILPTSAQVKAPATKIGHPAVPVTAQSQSTFSPSAFSTFAKSFTLPGLFMSNTSTPLPDPSMHQPMLGTTLEEGGRAESLTGHFDKPFQDELSGSESSEAASYLRGDTLKAFTAPNMPSKPKGRAVAADFDSPPDVAKRPFGQSRPESTDEEMIIEVSDDTDDEDIAGGAYRLVESHPNHDSSSTSLMHQHPHFGASSPLGPSGALTPGGLDYQRKMAEIEDMKRKLAEAEMRRRGRTTATPTASSSQAIEAPLVTPATGPAVLDVVQSNLRLPDAISEAQIGERLLSIHQSSTPLLSSKEQEKAWLKQRLAELERSRAEAKIQSTQAVPNIGITAATTPGSSAEGQVNESSASGHDHISASKTDTDVTMEGTSDRKGLEDVQLGAESTADLAISDAPPIDVDSMKTTVESVPSAAAQIQIESFDNGQEQEQITAMDDALPSEVAIHPDTKIIPADSYDVSALPGLGGQLSNGASPQHQDENRINGSDQESQAMDESSDNESNSSSADSFASVEHEGDHRPEQINTLPEAEQPIITSIQVEGDYEPHASTSSMDEDDSTNDSSSDSYEPLPQPAESHIQGAMLSTQESQGDDDYEPDGQIPMLDHISAPSLYDPNKIVADIDLALELQLDDNQLYPIRSHPPDKPTKVRYTAYHSPLEQFKDFRYHPNYASIVPGGFKSLTYNHKINPDTPLCPYEASGGRCNDPNCNFQHFANMGFTDNELIRILGTEYGNHHEEIRNEFNRGLAAIVNELKASSLSRDVNAIAQRIVNFRRGFLGDPSRVLDFEWWDKKYGSKQEEEVAQ